jgi:hypothetical protein
MPFPIIAAIGLGISAYAARDQIRKTDIINNQQRRQAERELKLLSEQTSSAQRQTLAEQDKRLPFALSLPSKASNSYEESPVIDIAGTEVKQSSLLIGAVALVIGFLIIKKVL